MGHFCMQWTFNRLCNEHLTELQLRKKNVMRKRICLEDINLFIVLAYCTCISKLIWKTKIYAGQFEDDSNKKLIHCITISINRLICMLIDNHDRINNYWHNQMPANSLYLNTFIYKDFRNYELWHFKPVL